MPLSLSLVLRLAQAFFGLIAGATARYLAVFCRGRGLSGQRRRGATSPPDDLRHCNDAADFRGVLRLHVT